LLVTSDALIYAPRNRKKGFSFPQYVPLKITKSDFYLLKYIQNVSQLNRENGPKVSCEMWIEGDTMQKPEMYKGLLSQCTPLMRHISNFYR